MPERIGRFRLQSMLGRGAMGVVYRGHDEEIDRLVAIKLIRADLLDTEERENYLRRFRNEAKIAGRCVHANIVGLYDFALHEGNPYLVMEYVNGVGLQQAIPRGTRRAPAEVLHIALQVLDALHYAHERGIVHRDIKPANILLTPQTSLKITDFGISRLTSMELTATPLVIGTPSYMSPEQCYCTELDGRSDLFSLGCVLYELLAGERPFVGTNYADTIYGIVHKPHAPLSSVVDGLPEGLSKAIDRALMKNADDRYADAAEFARALSEIVHASGAVPALVPTVAAEAVWPEAVTTPAREETVSGTLERPSLIAVTKPETADPDRVLLRFVGEVPVGQEKESVPSNEAVAGPAVEQASAIAAEPAVARTGTVARTGAVAAHPEEHQAELQRITRCLAEIMGPIAPRLVWRAEMTSSTYEAIVQRCAGYVRHGNERARFLALVSQPDGAGR